MQMKGEHPGRSVAVATFGWYRSKTVSETYPAIHVFAHWKMLLISRIEWNLCFCIVIGKVHDTGWKEQTVPEHLSDIFFCRLSLSCVLVVSSHCSRNIPSRASLACCYPVPKIGWGKCDRCSVQVPKGGGGGGCRWLLLGCDLFFRLYPWINRTIQFGFRFSIKNKIKNISSSEEWKLDFTLHWTKVLWWSFQTYPTSSLDELFISSTTKPMLHLCSSSCRPHTTRTMGSSSDITSTPHHIGLVWARFFIQLSGNGDGSID